MGRGNELMYQSMVTETVLVLHWAGLVLRTNLALDLPPPLNDSVSMIKSPSYPHLLFAFWSFVWNVNPLNQELPVKVCFMQCLTQGLVLARILHMSPWGNPSWQNKLQKQARVITPSLSYLNYPTESAKDKTGSKGNLSNGNHVWATIRWDKNTWP